MFAIEPECGGVYGYFQGVVLRSTPLNEIAEPFAKLGDIKGESLDSNHNDSA